jgi:hypothetical protein
MASELWEEVQKEFLAAVEEQADALSDSDKTLIRTVAEEAAKCVAAKQLGLPFSPLVLESSYAQMANVSAGLKAIAAKSFLAIAKRMVVWLLKTARDIGAEWLEGWVRSKTDRIE